MSHEFTCDLCGETFESDCLNGEALKELYKNMPEAINDELGICCDDCYPKFMEWYKKLSIDDLKKIRLEYETNKSKDYSL